MSRHKYLYRVQGVVSLVSPLDGHVIEYVRTWHYQSKAAAENRFLRARDGWSHTVVVNGETMTYTHRPLKSVTFERSDPVTWSESPSGALPPAPAGKVRRRSLRAVPGGAA